MKHFFVFLLTVCFLTGTAGFSADLDAEIQSDLKGLKCSPYQLLKEYTAQVTLDKSGKIAKKIAAILGRGAGVGGFKKTRSATKVEKDAMVKALDAAYSIYPLQEKDFFASVSETPSIKKHQAILFGLVQTMAMKVSKGPEKNFSAFKASYRSFRDAAGGRNSLQWTVKSLIKGAGLKDYDAALGATETLFGFADLNHSFFKGVFNRESGKLRYGTKPYGPYGGALDDVVNVHTYNHGRDSGLLSSKTSGGIPMSPLFDPIRQSLEGRNIELSVVIQSVFPVDGAPYELRPHGWTDPDAPWEPGYNTGQNILAGIFGNPNITISGQAPNTIAQSSISTHPGESYTVLSPDNMHLTQPNGPLGSPDSYAFISAVLDESNKAILTLHLLAGDSVLGEITRLAGHQSSRTINAGDLLYGLHFSPKINPQFLKLLNDLYS